MDVLETNGNFIVRNGNRALYCDRLSGKLSIKDAELIDSEWNPVCLGQVDGVIGKLRYYPDSPWRLFLIEESDHVGFLPDGMEIRRISRVCALALTTAPCGDLTLRPCNLNHPEIGKRKSTNLLMSCGRRPLIRQVQRRLRDAAGAMDYKLSHNRQRIKYEKRIHEEIARLLRLEEDSFFYFSPGGGDVTNWTQSKLAPSYWTGISLSPDDSLDTSVHRQPVWRRANSQFFWNINLLSEPLADADRLLAAEGLPPFGHRCSQETNWNDRLVQMISDLEGLFPPIVQGFVEVERIPLRNSIPSSSYSPSARPKPQPVSRTTDAQSSVSKARSSPVTSVFYLRNLSSSGAINSVNQTKMRGFPTDKVKQSSDTTTSQQSSRSLCPPTLDVESSDKTSPLNSTKSSPVHSAESEISTTISSSKSTEELTVVLFSRRSRHRAGTRYRRRGIDPEGHVANYVETEQIIQTHEPQNSHTAAFLQVRGSVPVFWSQTSLKYRPPINLEKDVSENQAAFSKHWDQLLARFEHVVIVNLLDCGPRRSENRLLEAYLRHLLLLNDEKLTFILFDFHDYCRGLRFQNASVLLSGTVHLLRDMKFCWASANELLCEQTGIFRVNCLDCLDRTNLVQCLYAGVVMTTQLKKFGLLGPDDSLPIQCTRLIQRMWANNGDAISQQYAGTVALKGDYTRTGERTMNGLVRDGVSSMNRYYLRFRELARQAAIDLLLGNETSAELALIRSGAGLEAASIQAREESLRLLIHRCREALLDPEETNLAECLLSSYTDLAMEQQFANILLVVSDRYLHFIRTDLPVRSRRSIYARIPVDAIQKVELGLEPSVFRSRRHVLRIFYDPPKTEVCRREPTEPAPADPITQPSGANSDLSNDFLKSEVKSEPEPSTAGYSSTSDSHSPCSDSELAVSVHPSDFGRPENIVSRNTSEDRVPASFLTASAQLPPTFRKRQDSRGEHLKSPSRLPKPNVENRHFLAFFQPNVRLFNTVLVPVPPGDESFQALRVVGAMILVAVRATGRNLELSEYPNRVKLNRVRRASLPSLYQPPVNLEALFSDTKLPGLRRDTRRPAQVTRTDEQLLEGDDGCSDDEVEKKSIHRETSEVNGLPSGVDLLKQRLTKFKLPNICLKPSGHTPASSQSAAITSVDSASLGMTGESPKRLPSVSDRFFSELSRVLERPILGGGRLFPKQQMGEVSDNCSESSPQPKIHISGPHMHDVGVSEKNDVEEDDPGNTIHLSGSFPADEAESDTEAVERDYEDDDGEEEMEEDEPADDEEDAALAIATRDQLLAPCHPTQLATTGPTSKHYRSKSCTDAAFTKDHQRLLSLDQVFLRRTGDILNILSRSSTHVQGTTESVQPQMSSIPSIERVTDMTTAQCESESPPVIFGLHSAIFKSDSNLFKKVESPEARPLLIRRFVSERTLPQALTSSGSIQPFVTDLQFGVELPKWQSENTLFKKECLPNIVLTNLKHSERMRKKQTENLVWLDELRHQLCPNQSIKTSFIIF
ncbi:hypothetical protein CRM22_010886 [Opisthorchis felineus]|uniref:SAC domain-containing protein n=1 Tax=Opisthorchis felineus TaxID=147828 RepID=A0A4S2KPT2_OPIFE|nr:hypothetical protein CRM22_010886 [Opisthorchis felineus]